MSSGDIEGPPLNCENQELLDIIQGQIYALNYTAYYMFVPIFIVLMVMIWVAYGFGWISLPAASFMGMFILVILYWSSVLYRVNIQILLQQEEEILARMNPIDDL